MTVETIVSTAAEPTESTAEQKDNQQNEQPASPVAIIVIVKIAWITNFTAVYLITGIVMSAMISPEIGPVLAGITVSVIVSQ
jgi:hypothetical protein